MENIGPKIIYAHGQKVWRRILTKMGTGKAFKVWGSSMIKIRFHVIVNSLNKRS